MLGFGISWQYAEACTSAISSLLISHSAMGSLSARRNAVPHPVFFLIPITASIFNSENSLQNEVASLSFSIAVIY